MNPHKNFVIIGITGMPGAKKTSVAKMLSGYGIPCFTLSSTLGKELVTRGLNPTPTNYAKVASELREKLGEDIIARRTWNSIKVDAIKNAVIIDGIRSPAEVHFFHTVGKGFFLVSVHASPETRFRRFRETRHPFFSTREQFEAQDRSNLELGMAEVIAQADCVIVNEDYCEKSIRDQVYNLYQFLKKKIPSYGINEEKTPTD